MENEKRMVGDYTVLCAVNIGSREIILAENEQDSSGERFLCCYGERNDIFEKFTECAVGDDYIDAALFFAERIKKDAEQFRAEVEKLDIPVTVITQVDCIPRIPHRCREDFNGALLQDGDVIIADTAEDETTGKACEIGNLQGSAIVSGLHTMVCRPRNRMALGYLGYYLNSNAYHHQLLPLMQGIKVLSLSRSNIQKTSVSYPIAVKEQQLIAYYFSQLDNLITLHQRECISFTGRADRLILTANKKRTTSSWEQRKLGEIGSVSMCRRIFKEQTSETGDIPFYKIGTFGADPDAFISRELFEEYKSKYPYPQKGDILISASGSIGRTVEFAGNNEYFQDSNIVWLNHDERLSNPFLKCFYSVVKWAGIEGSTIKRLYNDNILNTVICMPSVPEQKRIGLFFENLDNLITLHQRKPFLMKWRTSDANRNQTNRLVL